MLDRRHPRRDDALGADLDEIVDTTFVLRKAIAAVDIHNRIFFGIDKRLDDCAEFPQLEILGAIKFESRRGGSI